MLGSILKFVASPGGTIAAYLVGALFAIGTLAALYKMHNDGIRREALAEYNKTQLEETVRNQKEFILTLKKIGELQQEAVIKLDKNNKLIDERIGKVEDFLNSEEAKKSDRSASSVLRETLRQLGAQ